MRLRTFAPQVEIEEIQVSEKELYPDAEAIEDGDIFDANIPSATYNASHNGPEREMAEIYLGAGTPTVTDIFVPDDVACKIATKLDTPLGRQRQTIAQSQHPQMEIERSRDEGVPCTLLPESKKIVKQTTLPPQMTTGTNQQAPAKNKTPTHNSLDPQKPATFYARSPRQKCTQVSLCLKLVMLAQH